jgi:hypothetical protein
MKTTKMLSFVIFSLFFIGCNSDDNEIDGISNNQIKFIKTVSDGVESAYYYENGKILKGVGNSTPNHNNYHSSFQVEYIGNRVKSVYYSNGISYPKPADFNFNYDENTPNITHYKYNYDGNKLKSISYGSTEFLLWEFFYDNQGRIIETIEQVEFNEVSNFKFFYDSNGKVDSYIRTIYYSGTYIYSGSITLDDKINPFYILWEKFNFIFPPETNGLSNKALPFFSNNILEMYEENDVYYKAQLSYDGEYPVFYREITSGSSSGKSIEYLN